MQKKKENVFFVVFGGFVFLVFIFITFFSKEAQKMLSDYISMADQEG